MTKIDEMLIWLGLFAMVVLIIWIRAKFNARSREMVNSERMAMIEKGITDFPMEEVKKVNTRNGINILRYMLWGLIMGFFLTGLGLAFTISSFMPSIDEPEMLIPGLILLFPGLGMLLFAKIASKMEKEKAENKPPEQLNE